ncbi:MAG: VOC family protein, partial [Saprospiraceae bacterium]|nr:VOC family protein [Saprospiraceae bacterium]
RTFYEAIFEIELQVLNLGDLKMGMFPHRGVGCAICHGKHYQAGASGPVVYLDANPDLLLVQNRIGPAGGEVLMPKKQISPEHGYMALFTDPEGNRLALRSSK